MGMGDVVFLYQPQGFFRVPFIHQNRTHTSSQWHHNIKGQGSGMISRPGTQDPIGIRVISRGSQGNGRGLGCCHGRGTACSRGCRPGQCFRGALTINTFRPTRSPRGIKHLATNLRVVDITFVFRGQGSVISIKPCQFTSHSQRHLQLVTVIIDRIYGRLGAPIITDKSLGFTVANDIRSIIASEVPVDRRDPVTGAHARIINLEEFRAVNQQHGHTVVRLQAGLA